MKKSSQIVSGMSFESCDYIDIKVGDLLVCWKRPDENVLVGEMGKWPVDPTGLMNRPIQWNHLNSFEFVPVLGLIKKSDTDSSLTTLLQVIALDCRFLILARQFLVARPITSEL